MNRLLEKYQNEIAPKLKTEFSLSSNLALPRVTKIVINCGCSDAKDNDTILAKLVTNITAISGQKPVVTKAKKSISAFRLTQGQSIGIMVTLRGDRMYAFLDKLINAVLPKVRDFRGISINSFDSTGNYNLGLREFIIFPEVDYKDVDKQRGLQITIATSAKTKEQGKRLLEEFGMPFTKGEQN